MPVNHARFARFARLSRFVSPQYKMMNEDMYCYEKIRTRGEYM